MKFHRKCRVCDWHFWTDDKRKKECSKSCAELISSNSNGGKTMRDVIDRARQKHKKRLAEENAYQDFTFGRRIIFR